jgi:hypothetical protein
MNNKKDWASIEYKLTQAQLLAKKKQNLEKQAYFYADHKTGKKAMDLDALYESMYSDDEFNNINYVSLAAAGKIVRGERNGKMVIEYHVFGTISLNTEKYQDYNLGQDVYVLSPNDAELSIEDLNNKLLNLRKLSLAKFKAYVLLKSKTSTIATYEKFGSDDPDFKTVYDYVMKSRG